jgi:hypothetical protein
MYGRFHSLFSRAVFSDFSNSPSRTPAVSTRCLVGSVNV